MTQPEGRSIIENSDILSEDYLPSVIQRRENQINEMFLSLAPAIRGIKPSHIWLCGKPGSGKTALTRFVLKKIRDENSIKGSIINCWKYRTLYSVLDFLVKDLRILRAEEQRIGAKLSKFEKYIGNKPFIIVLDEIDHAHPQDRDSMIYVLGNTLNVGLICISTTSEPLFSLEPRVSSRMNPVVIQFYPYTTEDLVYILEERAELGLKPGTWTLNSLVEIAELAEGDARIAIQTLKKACHFADQEHNDRISACHIDRGWESAKRIKTSYILKKLTEDHRILYRIVNAEKEIDSRRLWETYKKRCMKINREPIALRTFSEYMNRLAQGRLITTERARVKGKVRLFKVVE